MSPQATHFADLPALAKRLRRTLNQKKYVLLFAYNGTGKTRLSMAFKELGKRGDARDTLYFNAFTEDLFTWNNDLEGDRERVLRMNRDSHFFDGLEELEMENRIRPLLSRYADFGFRIDYEQGTVIFSREVTTGDSTQTVNHIKVSRGEENLFVWCFFLAVAQLAIDGQEAYRWVKYIYIDDPISSLDDNNAVAVAAQLAEMLKGMTVTEGAEEPGQAGRRIKIVLSSHHHLFFNLMCNELSGGKQAKLCFLHKDADGFVLKNMGKTPRYHHVAVLKQLCEVAESGKIFTYHFNMLRGILERTAAFHGFTKFSDCIRQGPGDSDGAIHARLVNLLSHGNYSLYEPTELLPENKNYFRQILNDFMTNYRFNPELLPAAVQESTTP
ncbi:MAG TPA: AAA family ATPase [Gammaproteobacteria bacterium]|nr:AAA family ATPase [Gammaproteobacteria bacterium]